MFYGTATKTKRAASEGTAPSKDNENLNKFYMYLHRDPDNNYQTVYVGKGCGGRAWDVSRNRGGHPDHVKWMNNLMEKGYTPDEWVLIMWKGLSEQEALAKEKDYLHTKGCPRFNRQSGERNYQAKLTDEQARTIFLRAPTTNHQELAEEFGVSRSAISMIASRKQWRAATACLI